MQDTKAMTSEAQRLERLWAGDFGDAYVDRNRVAGDVRSAFWHAVLHEFPARRVLEIGCSVGGNLRWVAEQIPAQDVYGIDINERALAELREHVPGVNALRSPARELPFRDAWFDLVFTMGVLIHQPDTTLPLVISEMVRCSRRYVLCGEYFAEDTIEVPYRGQSGALLKRDYGRIVQELCPDLALRKQGFLAKDQGWDDVTYWIFEKTY